MKLRVLLLFLIISTVSHAQTKKDIPAGFEWVKKRGLLISRTEITVAQWVKFMKSQMEEDWLRLAPASNAINDKCTCRVEGSNVTIFNPAEIIFRDTTFVEVDSKKGKKTRAKESCADMPITGITPEQAKEYANWFSEGYADFNFDFRLPTPEEMEDLLTDIFGDFKPGQENYDAYKNGINLHGCAIYNHAHNSWCDNNKNMKLRYGYGVPMEVGFFFADWNGLMDMMGNVAEMTSEPGISMGGSSQHPASACQPGVRTPYDGPQPWLGFRLVCDAEIK